MFYSPSPFRFITVGEGNLQAELAGRLSPGIREGGSNEEDGIWRLSPAYDITFTVNYKNSFIGDRHAMSFMDLLPTYHV